MNNKRKVYNTELIENHLKTTGLQAVHQLANGPAETETRREFNDEQRGSVNHKRRQRRSGQELDVERYQT